jgi:hypothetical protein
VQKEASRILGTATLLLYQQQPALLVAVERIYGGEQTRPLDQPWLIVRIDVEDDPTADLRAVWNCGRRWQR